MKDLKMLRVGLILMAIGLGLQAVGAIMRLWSTFCG